MRRFLPCLAALSIILVGCVPGHQFDPSVAGKPLPVTFYGGHVLSVVGAAIGAPDAGAAITLDLRPTEIVGAHVRAGWQPAGGKASITAAGIDIGPEIEAPASALEYTVAMDASPQILQIAQYILPEDCELTPGCVLRPPQRVVVRVAGNTARVLPEGLVPGRDRGRIVPGGIYPLGGGLASPPGHWPPLSALRPFW